MYKCNIFDVLNYEFLGNILDSTIALNSEKKLKLIYSLSFKRVQTNIKEKICY